MLYKLRIRAVMQNRYLGIVLGVRLLVIRDMSFLESPSSIAYNDYQDRS